MFSGHQTTYHHRAQQHEYVMADPSILCPHDGRGDVLHYWSRVFIYTGTVTNSPVTQYRILDFRASVDVSYLGVVVNSCEVKAILKWIILATIPL